MTKLFFNTVFFIFIAQTVFAQGNFTDDESDLRAKVKQINQFFLRFNGEENPKGERLYKKDIQFRSEFLRKEYLKGMFDEASMSGQTSLKNKFTTDAISDGTPYFIDFYGGKWYAEVNASMLYNGRLVDVLLYLKIQKSHKGSKWAITKVYFEEYNKYFEVDTAKYRDIFLHPMSHELGFINIRKMMNDKQNLQYYADEQMQSHHLSVFLYESKLGKFEFKTIKNVKFHILQVPGWYFELDFFNRKGYNSGWLINNLNQVDKTSEKAMLKFFDPNL